MIKLLFKKAPQLEELEYCRISITISHKGSLNLLAYPIVVELPSQLSVADLVKILPYILTLRSVKDPGVAVERWLTLEDMQ